MAYDTGLGQWGHGSCKWGEPGVRKKTLESFTEIIPQTSFKFRTSGEKIACVGSPEWLCLAEQDILDIPDFLMTYQDNNSLTLTEYILSSNFREHSLINPHKAWGSYIRIVTSRGPTDDFTVITMPQAVATAGIIQDRN